MKKSEREATPDAPKRPRRKRAAPAKKALKGEAPRAAAADPLAGPTEIAAALKAAGYGLDEIAPALITPGVYPALTAVQLGTVLISPPVFPSTTREQMGAALQVAKFPPADIDAALASLFPARDTIKDGAILAFKYLGTPGSYGFVWLNGRFSDGYVDLCGLDTGGSGTSTRWKAHAMGNDVYAFECLGGGPGASLVWLDGRTQDGTVGLAPNTTERYSGTRWKVVKQSDNSYWLKCLGSNANPQHVWLASGRGAYDNVGLAPTPAGGLNVDAIAHVYYQVYMTGAGWTPEESDWRTIGDPKRQLEAVKIRIHGRHVTYQAHVADRGWMGEVSDGAEAGTIGQSRRMEAVRIRADRGHVYYQAAVEKPGAVNNMEWMPEVSDGADAGTTGRARKMLGLLIRSEDTTPRGCTAVPWEAVPQP
jgi:hypothetical protein